MNTRTPFIAGNWKMNLNHFEAIAHVQKIGFTLPEKYYAHVDVCVIPPFTDLRSVQTLVDGDKLQLTYGAQDISLHDSGAYTGEISGAFLSKLGCTYVLVGHSERRLYHHETNEVVLGKVKAALRYELTPIVCVGEDLEVREACKHVEHIETQVRASLSGLSPELIAKLVIAYEPIWAIGTGKVASSADAQEICGLIRETVGILANKHVAAEIKVLYGGSVSSQNIGDLIAQPDIDGALVGGASLKADDFSKICATAAGGVSIIN